MGLTGTLRDGTRIERIGECGFESDILDSQGEVDSCHEWARYYVIFESGEVMNACEEHAQALWDADEALSQTVEEPASADAVDPVTGRGC